MSHPAFELIRTVSVPSLNLGLEEYRHGGTGARHFHLASEDGNNAFLVAFLTVPKDSTGVAHILEHTSLCGSRRYPVRDPFFMMIRRSLNTFMNAFTASDWTAYPFASQNRKDFDNLLKVYLDAAFFPKLDELDFAQEGHRLEFEKPHDPESPLMYRGVVYNEMKGAMSSPTQMLWHHIHHYLYPTITYHYNSGGEPEHIPELTHEQLLEFHRTHYHPSNAVFMTYGNWPAEEHQAHFQDYALKEFSGPLNTRFYVPDEQRYTQSVVVEEAYPLDGEEESTRGKTHIVLAWLLGKSFDQRELMNAYLLSGVLLDHSASPLRHALETSGLGSSPSPLCGLDSNPREMGFYAGVEGAEPEQAEAVEALILDVLERVAREGIPQEHVESVLHQIELGQREITGDHFPYGLQLMVHALGLTLHGGDPMDALHIDPVLDALREDIKEPGFIRGLVQQLLLDNPHRVRLTLKPDHQLTTLREQAETERLAAIKAGLSEADRRRIVERAEALEARQRQEDDPELLPKVELQDVPPDLKIAEGRVGEVAGSPVTWYGQPTNGMVYQQVVVELPQLDPELLNLMPLLCDVLSEVGIHDQDYLTVQARQAAISGGVGARVSMRGSVDDPQKIRALFVVSGKALARNHGELTALIKETFLGARFDEFNRLRELMSQLRTGVERSLASRGMGLALNAAVSGMNPAGALSYRWSGMAGARFIKQLDESLKQAGKLEEFGARLRELRDILLTAPRQFLVIGEPDNHQPMAAALEQQWGGESAPPPNSTFNPYPVEEVTRQAWAINTQVNFMAKAYPVVPYTHPDAPVLLVLGEFLRNGFLHRAIREQGGAYGGGAGYDSDTCSFRFYSYRDPRLGSTLADFDHSLAWLETHDHDIRTLEEAVLGVISRIDRPASPAGEAKSAFFGLLHGRDPENRRAFRRRVLQVTLEDLRRVGDSYLRPERASIAVLSNARTLDKEADELGLEVSSL